MRKNVTFSLFWQILRLKSELKISTYLNQMKTQCFQALLQDITNYYITETTSWKFTKIIAKIKFFLILSNYRAYARPKDINRIWKKKLNFYLSLEFATFLRYYNFEIKKYVFSGHPNIYICRIFQARWIYKNM